MGQKHQPLYEVWKGMKARCLRPTHKDYRLYGGRGITICHRWRTSLALFAEDMGPRPSPTHTLDRINNNGNYEPGNCRWATPKEQGANRRIVPVRRHRGESMHNAKLNATKVRVMRRCRMGTITIPLHELAQMFGVSKYTVQQAVSGNNWGHVPQPT